MFVGHVAVAVGASKAAPRVNLGWMVFGALLADFLLGIFSALGLEHFSPAPDFPAKHYFLFAFPYSHGLLAMLVWAAVFGLLLSRHYGQNKKLIGLTAALVVLSHFLLDGLVHVAGLPLAGSSSFKFGLGLWNHLPLELTIETVMGVAALAIYWSLRNGTALSRWGISTIVGLAAMATWTQIRLTAPPPQAQLILSWLVTPPALAAVVYFLDRDRARATM